MTELQPALPGFANHRLHPWQCIPEEPEPDILVSTIQQAVATHFSIPPREMLSSRRNRSVARPRQIAMYLARELTRHSYPSLGRFFGDRDHATIMHGCRQIEHLCKTDCEICGTVNTIYRRLLG